MILPQLGAAKRMTEQVHAVDPLRILGFLEETLLDLSGNAVDTANGRYDPQLVADPYFPTATAIKLHFPIRSLRR
ncbi:hypothetical protein D3C78_1726680 [compost metagenome]